MSEVLRTTPSRFPMFEMMRRIPGGLMLIPLALGVLVNTFAPDALGIGSFTTALFKEGAVALIALMVRANGASITGTHNSNGGAGTTLVVLLAKTLIPIRLVVGLGHTG